LALQRFDQAHATIDRAKAHDMDGYMFRLPLFAMGFLGGDSSSMAEQQQWLFSHPDSKHYAFSLASDTEAYGVKLTAARELTKRSAEAAIAADSKENAAIWWENAVLREAASGDASQSVQDAVDGLKLAPESQGVGVEAALAKRVLKIMMRSSWGTDDPTRASFVFAHALALSDARHEVQIFLTADATYLMRKATSDAVIPIGWPPLSELREKIVAKHIPVFS
jgi:hypothetical protein